MWRVFFIVRVLSFLFQTQEEKKLYITVGEAVL
jgi:hypothetical protein